MKLGIFPINTNGTCPADITMKGKKLIQMDEATKPIDGMELLESLGKIDAKANTNQEKLKALKDVLNKTL